MRTCKICKEEKHISCFNKKGEYYDTYCKVCRNDQQREYRRNKAKLTPKKEKKSAVFKVTKVCTCCKIEKAKTEFTQLTYKNGVKYCKSKCKECIKKEYEPKKKYTCVKCNKEKTEAFYDLKKKMCSTCIKKAEHNLKAKLKRNKVKSEKELLQKGMTESIFDFEHRLRLEGKKIAKDNVKTEAWKLANGYTWVTEEVQVTKTTTRKQRVLRKVNK